MRIPVSWIKQYIKYEVSNERIAELLTMAGTEVSEIIKFGDNWDENIIVGEITKIEKHPDADRLSLVEVNDSKNIIKVVCGAKNILVTQKIALAKPGANLFNPYEKKMSILKKSKIRGVESNGMICSAVELGYSEDHDGILVLDPKSKIGNSLHSLLSDDIFDLDITPNRADCLSVVGIIREIACILKAQNINHELINPINFENQNLNISNNKNNLSVKINDTSCNRYSGVSMNAINIGESPFWIKDKLIKSGLRPINNIVDLTNFIMLEYGQPMHAFDISKIKSNKIEIKKFKNKKDFIGLDQEKRELNSSMLTITDGENPIGLAGIIGGENSEIDNKTSDIFLESASFSMSNIRETSKELNLSTDASYRFERGVPENLTVIALNRAIELLTQVNNKKPQISGFWDEYPNPSDNHSATIEFTSKRYKKIIGESIAMPKAKSILADLGFLISSDKKDKSEYSIKFYIPFWRNDINIEDDLIEEIARTIGYDNLGSSPMLYPEKNIPIDESVQARNKLRSEMKSMGYLEVINYPVLNDIEYEAVNNADGTPIELQNPINQKNKYMRPNLRSGLIDNLTKNSSKYSDIESWKFFELGRTYTSVISDKFKLPTQSYSLGIIASGRAENSNWSHGSSELNFYTFKGYIEKLLNNLNIKFELSQNKDISFYNNKSALIISNNLEVGSIGFVSEKILVELNSKIKNVLYAEFNLDHLLTNINNISKYKKSSLYPQAIRDLSFIMDNKIFANDIIKIINSNPLVSEINIIDVYEDLDKNRKSVTFRLSYQSFNETLSNKQIEESQNKILKLLKKNLNIELRK